MAHPNKIVNWVAGKGKDGEAEILGIGPSTLASTVQRVGIQKNKKNA